MRTLRSLRQSFACAFRGVGRCVRQERNFRIHLTAAVLLFWLASRLSLDRVEWALLLVAVGMMLAAELFNTALEWFCDRVAPGWDKLSRQVKDLSAGAVLVCAVFCAGAGIALLWRPVQLWEILRDVAGNPFKGGIALLCGGAAVAFVVAGPPFPAGKGRRGQAVSGENGKERMD